MSTDGHKGLLDFFWYTSVLLINPLWICTNVAHSHRTKCGVVWLAITDDARAPKIVFTNKKIFFWKRWVCHCWSLGNYSLSITSFDSWQKNLLRSRERMKIFFATLAIAYFIATNANLSVKPTKSDQMRKAQCHMTYKHQLLRRTELQEPEATTGRNKRGNQGNEKKRNQKKDCTRFV